jgi:hypothetical protein
MDTVNCMRPLTNQERQLLSHLAEKLEEPARSRLIADVQAAEVESASEDGSRLLFHINGYERPPYKGQREFPVYATVRDADGEHLSIALYADQNDRLFELEFIRFAEGTLISPDWSTLSVT